MVPLFYNRKWILIFFLYLLRFPFVRIQCELSRNLIDLKRKKNQILVALDGRCNLCKVFLVSLSLIRQKDTNIVYMCFVFFMHWILRHLSFFSDSFKCKFFRVAANCEIGKNDSLFFSLSLFRPSSYLR